MESREPFDEPRSSSADSWEVTKSRRSPATTTERTLLFPAFLPSFFIFLFSTFVKTRARQNLLSPRLRLQEMDPCFPGARVSGCDQNVLALLFSIFGLIQACLQASNAHSHSRLRPFLWQTFLRPNCAHFYGGKVTSPNLIRPSFFSAFEPYQL